MLFGYYNFLNLKIKLVKIYWVMCSSILGFQIKKKEVEAEVNLYDNFK